MRPLDRRSLDIAQSQYAIGFVLGDLDELVDLLSAGRSVDFPHPGSHAQRTVRLGHGGDGVRLPGGELGRMGDVREHLPSTEKRSDDV